MLLAVDIGNTNLTICVFNGKKIAQKLRLETSTRWDIVDLSKTLATWTMKKRLKITDAVYGSVVPSLNSAFESAVQGAYGVDVVCAGADSPLGIALKVRTPSEVGADRLLNALAAFEIAKSACLIVDFGTATTFDCVSKTGDYLGGAILPGPNMAARALATGTAQLPLVPIEKPERVIGKDTVECLQAGLYYGYLGMIDKLVDLTVKEMRRQGSGSSIRLFSTGGLSKLYMKDMPKSFSWAPDLTLHGLRIAYEKIQEAGNGKGKGER